MRHVLYLWTHLSSLSELRLNELLQHPLLPLFLPSSSPSSSSLPVALTTTLITPIPSRTHRHTCRVRPLSVYYPPLTSYAPPISLHHTASSQAPLVQRHPPHLPPPRHHHACLPADTASCLEPPPLPLWGSHRSRTILHTLVWGRRNSLLLLHACNYNNSTEI